MLTITRDVLLIAATMTTTAGLAPGEAVFLGDLVTAAVDSRNAHRADAVERSRPPRPCDHRARDARHRRPGRRARREP